MKRHARRSPPPPGVTGHIGRAARAKREVAAPAKALYLLTDTAEMRALAGRGRRVAYRGRKGPAAAPPHTSRSGLLAA